MSRPTAEPPLPELRAAVQEAMGTRSLRNIARQIGISHTGLRGFLRGATPHAHTRRKLERWLARATAPSLREPGRRYAEPTGKASYDLLVALVRQLAAQASPELVDRAERELVALLEELYSSAGRVAPPWLD